MVVRIAVVEGQSDCARGQGAVVHATDGMPLPYPALFHDVIWRLGPLTLRGDLIFIFGVCVSRPKVYLSKQVGAASGALTDVFAWLPALLQDKPEISLREFAADTGPLFGNTTNGYWFDIRDLFLYGDQFTNIALTETDNAYVALPTVGLNWRYPASADVDGLFKAASPANKIRQDMICDLIIAGMQSDMT